MYINILYFAEYAVAPLVGAWIETSIISLDIYPIIVAPLVGAWIETLAEQDKKAKAESHPSWVRGLKLSMVVIGLSLMLSHPSWVRGLKPLSLLIIQRLMVSHPSWVRGLKLKRLD